MKASASGTRRLLLLVSSLAIGFGTGGGLAVKALVAPDLDLSPTTAELAGGLAVGTLFGSLLGRAASACRGALARGPFAAGLAGVGAGALFVAVMAAWWMLQDPWIGRGAAWGAGALGAWNGLLLGPWLRRAEGRTGPSADLSP